MRAPSSRFGAAVALLAAAAASLYAYPARALDTVWSTDQQANAHRLKGLPAPGAASDALRLQDVAVGACAIQASAAGFPATFSCLGTPDPFAFVAGNLTLKTDATLHVVAGQLSVVSSGPGTGAATSLLGVAGGSPTTRADIACSGDGNVVWDNGGTVVCAALPYSKLTGSPAAITQLTGDVTAGPGSGSQASTITANAVTLPKLQTVTGLSILGVPGSATANVSAITASANGQVMQMFGGTLQFHALDASSLTGTLGGGVFPALSGAVTSAGGTLTTAFGTAGAHSVLGVTGGSAAVPTFIGPATAGQVFMADPSTTALSWEIPPLVTLSAPGYMSAADKLKVNGGVTPTVSTDLLRFGDVTSCVGVVEWTGSVLDCAPVLTVATPLGIVSNVLSLSYDSTFALTGSNLGRAAVSGAVVVPAGSNASTFGAQTGLSILGVAGSSTAAPAAIVASAANTVPLYDGTSVAWRTMPGASVRADGIATGTVQLASVASSSLAEGTVAWVATVGDFFALKQSALTTTATTVITASGKTGYQWVRIGEPSLNWAAVTTWFLDPSGTCSDENTGASGHALCTFAELARRTKGAVYPSGSVITFNLLSASVANDNALFSGDFRDSTVFINGTPSAPIYSGTITSFTPMFTTAATDDNELVDSGLPTSFTASGLLADGVRFKETSSGLVWWAAKDLGSKTLRTSAPNLNGTLGAPTAGHAYTASTLPDIYSISFNTGASPANGFIFLRNLRIHQTDTGLGNIVAENSSFTGSQGTMSNSNVIGCSFATPPSVANSTATGISTWDANLIKGTPGTIFSMSGGNFQIDDTVFQGARLSIGQQGQAWASTRLSFYDVSGTAEVVLIRDQSRFLVQNGLGGSNNAEPIVALVRQSSILYEGTLTVAGVSTVTNSILVAGTPYPVSALPIIDVNGGDRIAVATPPLTLGMVKSNNSGVQSIATDGTDYLSPTTGVLVPGSNGLLAWTGSTTAARTLTNGDGTISFSNASGVAGNPEIHVNAIPESKVTSLVSDLAGKQATGNYVTAGTGPVTFSGPGSAATTVNLGAGGFTGSLPLGDLATCSAGQVIGMVGGVEGCVTPTAGTVYTGTSPIVVSGSAISCPTCAVGSGITQLTGDGTAGPGAGSQVFTLHNIPNGTTVAGYEDFTPPIAAPSTPGAGHALGYVDSTSLNWSLKDENGHVNHGARSLAAVATQFVTGLNDDGSWATARPVESDITGLVTDLAGKQATITYPVAGQALVSAGASSNPVGDSNFTYSTSTHTLTSAGGTVLGGSVTMSGAAGAGEILLGALNSGSVEAVFPFHGLTLSGGALGGVAFVASGSSHAMGMVPDPPSTAGSSKVLYEDAAWRVPPQASARLVYTTKLVWAGAGTPTGWLVTGSDVPGWGFIGGTFEYPVQAASPASATLAITVVHNNLGGTAAEVVNITRNGSTLGSGLTIDSSTTPGLYLIGPVSFSGSSADTFGVKMTGSGSATNGQELDMLSVLLLQ